MAKRKCDFECMYYVRMLEVLPELHQDGRL